MLHSTPHHRRPQGEKQGQVLQSNISRRVAGIWFIWLPWSISFVWFDERERQVQPAHQIDCF